MFYQEDMDDSLRFGDVLEGLVLTAPDIEDPHFKKKYKIDVEIPNFCVILTPCCTIGHKVITVSPLINVRNSYFNNPYFAEDLTRINRKMEPEKSVPSHVWEREFSDEKRAERLREGFAYAMVDSFIYEKKDVFSSYTVHMKGGENLETNYYMIDFNNIFKIKCKQIKSSEDAPMHLKRLQLSPQTRTELRDKIAAYFGRVPEEDEALDD